MKISPALRERFIISADDYGIRQTAVPILQLARMGKIDRAAVMVNYVTKEAAQALLLTDVKIDIHLDLIRLLKRGERPGDQTLWRGLHFTSRFLLGHLSTKKVEKEWRHQIEKFRELFGRFPDGLNSHEHTHFFPIFFRVAARLSTEYHIPHIRLSRRGMLLNLHSSIIGHILSRLRGEDRKVFEASRFTTSDYLVSYDWIRDWKKFTEKLPPAGTVEIVFHPERREEFNFLEHSFVSQ
jgi:predicted glycoside hydrolase/deacetylase ChbG (UPF0249 family)